MSDRSIILRSLSAAATRGRVQLAARSWPCVLGRCGRRARKREGDGATPLGRLRLIAVLYRADRVAPPRTDLDLQPIRPDDGWCDAPLDRNYNRRIRLAAGPLPYDARFEPLWRDDHVYDILVVLDYNIRPRTRNRGSAIFLHLTRPDRTPTEGCIALCERDLRQLLRLAGRRATIVVAP